MRTRHVGPLLHRQGVVQHGGPQGAELAHQAMPCPGEYKNEIRGMFPTVRALSRLEKLRLIQLLAEDLAQTEQSTSFEGGQTYPLWSPNRLMMRLLSFFENWTRRGLDRDSPG